MADSEQAHQPVAATVEQTLGETAISPVDDLDVPWGELPGYMSSIVPTTVAEQVDAEIDRAMSELLDPELAPADPLPPVTDIVEIIEEYPPTLQLQLFDEAFDEIDDLTYRVEEIERDIEDGTYAERLEVEREIDWLYDDIDRRFDVYQADLQEEFKEEIGHLRVALYQMAEADAAYFEGRVETVNGHLFDFADKHRELEARIENLEKLVDQASEGVSATRTALAHRGGLILNLIDTVRGMAQHIDRLDSEIREIHLEQEDLHGRQRNQSEIITGFVHSAAEIMSDQVLRIETVHDLVDDKLDNYGSGLERAFHQLSLQREHIHDGETARTQLEKRVDKVEEQVDRMDYDLNCCLS